MLHRDVASIAQFSSSASLQNLVPVTRGASQVMLPPSRLLRIEAGAGKKRVPRTESHKVLNLRARKRLTGTSEKPRLLVFCSDKHLYAQVIDDSKKATLLSACTSQLLVSSTNNESESYSPILDSAQKLGREVAMECQRQGITKVKYYRRGTLHWKRVKLFRLAVQDHGLQLEYPD